MLTHERAVALLDYDPESGVLYWREQRGRQPAGSRAGRLHHRGYREVRVDDVLYREHRVIWLIMTGQWPSDECDHINRLRSDNRWANLREASRSQNMRNLTRLNRNTSGYTGASFHKARGLWRATITIDGRQKHLGHFATAEEAGAAFQEERARLFPSEQ